MSFLVDVEHHEVFPLKVCVEDSYQTVVRARKTTALRFFCSRVAGSNTSNRLERQVDLELSRDLGPLFYSRTFPFPGIFLRVGIGPFRCGILVT